MNQCFISALMAQISSSPRQEISENLIRHIVLAMILSYKKKFGKDYGQIVFAADDRNYWRKEVFPYYKACRKKNRDESKYDWNLIFNSLNKIRDEIKENFPYKVIQVDKAEADDIIGSLTRYSQTNELQRRGIIEEPSPVLVLSGDKDFLQLQKYPNVKQYSPMQKKFLHVDDPHVFLKEHILRGDSGDGIPNFLSEDNILVTPGLRQKPLTAKKMEQFLHTDVETFECPTLKRNFYRNQQIIDLSFTPLNIQDNIVKTYHETIVGKKSKLMNYFIKNKLKHLMQDLSEF